MSDSVSEPNGTPPPDSTGYAERISMRVRLQYAQVLERIID
jgi:hypothetical protein